TVCLGALTVFDPFAPQGAADLSGVATIADALTHSVLMSHGAAVLPLLGEVDDRAQIHQASGIVSVQYGCTPADALALLKAHAFTHGMNLADVAEQVIQHDLRFDRGRPE